MSITTAGSGRYGILAVASGLALAVLGAPGLAAADADPADTVRIEVKGEADADAESAATRAADSAFVAAVGRALADMLDKDVRRRHRRDLNKNIIRRARRFVRSYKVLERAEEDGRLRIRASVQVDLARLRDRLSDLGIAVPEPGSSGESDGGVEAGRVRPKLVVVIQSRTDGEVSESLDADRGGPAGAAVVAQLRSLGFDIVPVGEPGDSAPDEAGHDGLPVSDEVAAQLARSAGAGGVVVVGLTIESAGAIRATGLAGAIGKVRLRVLDVADRDAQPEAVASVSIRGAGFGPSSDRAVIRAAEDLVDRAMFAVADRLQEYWPAPVGAGQAMVVEVRGFRSWSSVAALIRHLDRTRGIERVWPVRLGSRGVALAVDTELEARRLLSVLRRADVPDARRISVRSRGDREFEVRIRGDASGARSFSADGDQPGGGADDSGDRR